MKFIDASSRDRAIALAGPVDDALLGAVDFYVGRVAGIFVPRVEHCGHASAPDHAHPAWLFFVHLNERQVLTDFDTAWEREGLTVTVVPAGLTHTERPHELNARYAAIYLERDFFRQELARYPLPEGGQDSLPRTDAIFTFSVSNGILNPITEFIGEYEAALSGYDELLDATALRIAHRLIRGMRGIVDGSVAAGERMEIHKACDFIHEHYSRKLMVRQIAEIAAISESHFARVFKRETGHPPAEYVNMIRIDKAKKLLRAGGLSVTEIANFTGFASPSHFSTAFSRATGISPAEFREKGV